MNLLRSTSRETKLFVGLTVLYALMAFILPASNLTKAAYQLSDSQYHYLLFVVRLPILAVWCVAFYSYRRLANYAKQIAETDEGEGFTSIARAMKWIAWGLVVPAILRTSVIDTSQMYFEVGMVGQAVGLAVIVYSLAQVEEALA